MNWSASCLQIHFVLCIVVVIFYLNHYSIKAAVFVLWVSIWLVLSFKNSPFWRPFCDKANVIQGLQRVNENTTVNFCPNTPPPPHHASKFQMIISNVTYLHGDAFMHILQILQTGQWVLGRKGLLYPLTNPLILHEGWHVHAVLGTTLQFPAIWIYL